MIRNRQNLRVTSAFLLIMLNVGCTFNFELTSQKTALENQVTGRYDQLDDELVLISTVRSDEAKGMTPAELEIYRATENRKFNVDDISELKTKRILGETNDGQLKVLEKEKYVDATELDIKLSRIVVTEENRDREVLWKNMIASNANLTAGDLPKVKSEFAASQRTEAQEGEWIQLPDGSWVQKAPRPVTNDESTSEEIQNEETEETIEE